MTDLKKKNNISEFKVIGYVIFILFTLYCSSYSKAEREDKYLTKSMYKMLGLLGEYNSRFIIYTGKPRPDHLDVFDSDEKNLADNFEDCIQEYKKETSLDFEYTKKVLSGGATVFESTILSEKINSFYVLKDNIAIIDTCIFEDAHQDNLLNFIESVYYRFGDKDTNRIQMVNAFQKIEITAFVLEELGCTDIIKYTIPGVPSTNVLIFYPSKLVRNRLNIRHIIAKKDILPEIEYAKKIREDLRQEMLRRRYFHVSNNSFYPSNSEWTIDYAIPFGTNIEISVFNILNQKIATLRDEFQEQGRYKINWDIREQTEGIYIFMLKTDDFIELRKMVLVR